MMEIRVNWLIFKFCLTGLRVVYIMLLTNIGFFLCMCKLFFSFYGRKKAPVCDNLVLTYARIVFLTNPFCSFRVYGTIQMGGLLLYVEMESTLSTQH